MSSAPPPKFWSVVITRFEDDYKHRYDSGVYVEKSKLFHTQEAALTYLLERVMGAFNERVHDWAHLEETLVPIRKYIDEDENGIFSIKESFKSSLNAARQIQYAVLRGEFVAYVLDWDLDEVQPA